MLHIANNNSVSKQAKVKELQCYWEQTKSWGPISEDEILNNMKLQVELSTFQQEPIARN